MAKRSRTYRMCLSQEGTRLFLSCHHRLATLLGAFIPYGTTLFVAVLLADAGDPSDLLAELDDASVGRLAGPSEHFVGTSSSLCDLVTKIGDQLSRSDGVSQRPAVAHIHLASLAVMAGCEDEALTKAHRRMIDMLSAG